MSSVPSSSALLSLLGRPVIDGDDRLRPRRSVHRDQRTVRIRSLDETLVKSAAADVINACSQRRPDHWLGSR